MVRTNSRDDTTEAVECPICRDDNGRLLYQVFDKLAADREKKYNLMRCSSCGLKYLNPRPTKAAKAALYDQDYLFNPGRRAQPLEHYLPVIDRVRAKEPGRILDVGTGNSPFLPFMRKKGWEVFGTEINPVLVDWFQKENGIELAEGELEDRGFENNFFDAVTIMGVLEHTPDPRGLLAEASRILKDDGLLCLWCFNSNIEAALLRKYWMGFDAPRHLFSFSSDTLEKLLAATGFRVADIVYESSGSIGHSLAWALARARSRLTGVDEKHDYLLNLPRPVKRLNALVGSCLSRFGMSATMCLFATKVSRP